MGERKGDRQRRAPAAGDTRGGDAQRQGAQRDDAARAEDRAVEEIVSRGPGGAFAVAGVATVIVVAMFVLFYVFVYFPRGAVQ